MRSSIGRTFHVRGSAAGFLLLSVSGCPAEDGRSTALTVAATGTEGLSTESFPTTSAVGTEPEGSSTESISSEMTTTTGADETSTGSTASAGTEESMTSPDMTTAMTEGSECGDRIVEGVEECDDGGESPTCDEDCTMVACGDGTLNAAAGEQCDEAGESATCDANCSFVACGDGQYNATAGEQCDDGNLLPEDSCSPVCMATPVRIAVGRTHMCALDGDGAAHCWGNGDVGQLGYGNPNNLGDQPGELPSGDVNIGAQIEQISLGYHHSCAVLSDHGLRCWGSGEYGALGTGNTNNLGDQPGELPMPNIPVGIAVLKVAAGNGHTCVIGENQRVRCWGINDDGQLGYGNNTKLLTPNASEVPGIVDAEQIVAGAVHNCVLLTDDRVFCWGHGAYGQLGLGNNQSVGDELGEMPVTPTPVGDPDDPVVQLSAGWVHTCAVLRSGKVRCWGWNSTGQCGARFDDERIGDAPGEMPPPEVNLGGPAVQVVAGLGHSCALMADRTVKCWGDSLVHGYPGVGPINSAMEFPPPNVDLGGEVISVAGHLGSFTCAVLADKSLRCWGENNWGQLGNGSTKPIGDNEAPASIPPVPL